MEQLKRQVTMNKTKLIFAAVLLFTASCANEDVSKETESDRQNNQVLTTFTSGDAPATRTTIDYTVGGTGKFFWELGDKIFVTDDSGTPVASTSSTITGKTNYAKFQVPGTFTSTSPPTKRRVLPTTSRISAPRAIVEQPRPREAAASLLSNSNTRPPISVCYPAAPIRSSPSL